MQRFVNLTLNGITSGMIYAAVALALVMIWRATRIVNFAQGAMLMFTTFIAWERASARRLLLGRPGGRAGVRASCSARWSNGC